jgi:putative hydrolase of the HAD superfamily
MQKGRNDPMPAPALPHVDTWVFDLDNTLYPAATDLIGQVDRRITDFVATHLKIPFAEAKLRQRRWYGLYGTTLRGLMLEHEVNPDEYLDHVHDIDHTRVKPDRALEASLAALPGRKLVYTNGSLRHAESVIEKIGIAHHFSGVFDLKAADYIPKPDRASYLKLFERHAVRPTVSALFEDMERNLAPAAEFGMTTILVQCEAQDRFESGSNGSNGHVHHVAQDLAGWLQDLVEARRAG